ncbi:MAG: PIG-L deacetylase family protein [Candidatus Woesearchaeota archaeon]
MTILVCSPHPDDEVIGMGGTIAKYAQNERVVLIIFSLAERVSTQKKDAISTRREREARRAAQILGVQEILFFKLPDLKLKEELQKKYWKEEFASILEQEQPRAIFTTALDDLHTDHRAVAEFTIREAYTNKYQEAIWMYSVWNPLALLYRDQAQLIVDISDTLSTQWRALKSFESQKIGVYRLLPVVFLRRFLHGLRHKKRFVEVFHQAPKAAKKLLG